MNDHATKRLAIFISFSGAGGVERMVLNLLPEFVQQGIHVDVLAVRGDQAPAMPEGVRLIDLGRKHTRTALAPLRRYLMSAQPQALLAAKDRAIRVALKARRQTGVPTRIVGRLGTHLSASLESRGALRRWLRVSPMRRAYRDIDAVVAVSNGVAEDTHRLTGLDNHRIHVVANPVITRELFAQSVEPVNHIWLEPGCETAVIMGAGRLTRQKDFATLLAAFAQVRRVWNSRLIILGEGDYRDRLWQQACELGLEQSVDMPGFQANLPAWLARARVFVLSSLWEGSPNVLTEALALGVPCVATDCPSGPREILDGGRVSPLVPMSDPDALANAILRTLETPPDKARLQAAASAYHASLSAARYLDILGLNR